MQEIKDTEDSGDPHGARGTLCGGEHTAPKHTHLGSSPGPPRQDAGQQTDPFHEPHFPEGNSRALGNRKACVIPGEARRRLPPAPGPCSAGDAVLVFPFLPLLFPLSTARKTPHCMSASLPRVPGATLSTTSTRYEPLCDKALGGHAIFSPILRTEAAETQPCPRRIQWPPPHPTILPRAPHSLCGLSPAPFSSTGYFVCG